MSARERNSVREKVSDRVRHFVSERTDDRVQPKDSEFEWKTVRSRKRRHLCIQTHGRNGHQQQNNYHRRNWRDGSDITSFYFTRFPEKVTEVELWNHFSRWGEVKEIFIPNRKNKEGSRYGFVRLKGVADKRRVERDMDNSFIRGVKLHVNIPKYGRGKAMKNHIQHNLAYKELGMVDNVRNGVVSSRGARSKTATRTYAEVVVAPTNRTTHTTKADNHFAGKGGSWSSLTLDISEEDKRRYKNVWVGRLKKLETFERLEDEVAWHLGPGVSPKYFGDDMTLLLDLSVINFYSL